jgi:hypothetical protein
MRTSTVLVLGGVGLVGYLLYRSLKSTVQTAASHLASPVASNVGIPAGLQAQIDAGQYDASTLRATALAGGGALHGYALRSSG